MWNRLEKEQKGVFARICIAILWFVVVLALDHNGVFAFQKGKWFAFWPYLIPYLVVGYEVVIEAFEKIFHGRVFAEDFLMMLATVGAFAVSQYAEAVSVMILFVVGELFEDVAVDQSRESIENMINIQAEYANIEKDGMLMQVDPKEVHVGDMITVKPGERIPLDGIVFSGNSFLDTSSLTGESMPVSVQNGSEVFSGSINGNGTLKIRVTSELVNSTASRIMKLVEEAEDKKAPAERFITRFAKVYTPCVTIAAVLLALIPPLLFKGEWFTWIQRACTFLVISCPCALVISIPLSFFGGIGAASKQGILVKGSAFLESLTKVKTFVFDKTGTLTKGLFAISEIHTKEVSENTLLEIAACCEKYSTHPIAETIKQEYIRREGGKVTDREIEEHEEIPGKGVRVSMEGNTYYVGNEKLMESMQVSFEKEQALGTWVYVACSKGEENRYMGAILISDEIKEGAKETMEALKKLPADLVMLSGDRKENAEQVGEHVGISNIFAELLPEDKVHCVEKIMGERTNPEAYLAFVGDGMNDAPVLMRSDVGIAMGALGSHAATEASDVVIMDDDIRKIFKTIQISKKTLKIVRENIGISLGIKFLVLILGALGLASMWLAIFADVGVMIIAVLNALRTMRE